MATIARSEEMFTQKYEDAPAVHAGWDAFIRFISRILTPSWIVDYADDLAKDFRQREL